MRRQLRKLSLARPLPDYASVIEVDWLRQGSLRSHALTLTPEQSDSVSEDDSSRDHQSNDDSCDVDGDGDSGDVDNSNSDEQRRYTF